MRDLLAMLERAGFVEASCAGETGVATSRATVGALFKARRPG